MWIAQRRSRGMVAAVAMLLLSAGASAWAQERTYEGDIVAIDGKANTFTVKASKPGEVLEMAFHTGPKSEVFIDGNRVLFAELVKGDRVTVSYETAGATPTAHRTERQRTASKELTFVGGVSGIDLKAQTFTVKNTARGETVEMRFHFNPASRLYIGGEEAHMLAQLRSGETVTVTYESVDATTHNVKHVKKSA
jgi:ribosomal protein L19